MSILVSTTARLDVVTEIYEKLKQSGGACHSWMTLKCGHIDSLYAVSLTKKYLTGVARIICKCVQSQKAHIDALTGVCHLWVAAKQQVVTQLNALMAARSQVTA